MPSAGSLAASLLCAGLAAAITIGAAEWLPGLTATLVALGVGLHVIGQIFRSGFVVMLATFVLLGGAATDLGSGTTAWGRLLLTGILVYLAAELGWEAMARRDGSRRTVESVAHWFRDLVIVVGAAALMIGIGVVLADGAPQRNLLLQGIGFAVVIGMLFAAVSAPASEDPRR